MIATPLRVSPSVIPGSSVAKLLRPTAMSAAPARMPRSTWISRRRKIARTTLSRLAPNVMRTPISRVRPRHDERHDRVDARERQQQRDGGHHYRHAQPQSDDPERPAQDLVHPLKVRKPQRRVHRGGDVAPSAPS